MFLLWDFALVFLRTIGDLLYFVLIYMRNSLIENYLWVVVVHCKVGRAPRYSLSFKIFFFFSFALKKLFKCKAIISCGSGVNINVVFNTTDVI